jgi:hypothetical protein
LDEEEALALIGNWFLLNRDDWRNIWNALPLNVKEIVLETFLLREKFHQAKRLLLQLPLVIPAYVLPAYYNFVVLVVLAVRNYGITGAISYAQSYVDRYVSDGLERDALIHIASFQGVVGLS